MVISALLVCFTLLFTGAPPLHAAEESDSNLLELYYEPSDLAVSAATRSPRPLSRSAEDITVVTAAEIEAQNAHNLAEVLNRVPGVQVDLRGGLVTDYSLLGSSFRHVLVLVDGVSMSNLSDNAAVIAQIPVGNIERIEIVKGPASTAWGSALGGVINVITKSPRETAIPGGSASFSGGERGTRDAQGELTGTMGRLGYYLSGGNVRSDGFRPHNASDSNNLYAKLLWSLRDKGSIRFTINYLKGAAGEGVFPLPARLLPILSEGTVTSDLETSRLTSTLALNYHLTERLALDLALKGSLLDADSRRYFLTSGDTFQLVDNKEEAAGASALLTWRQGLHTVVGGMDFDHGHTKTSSDTFTLLGTFPAPSEGTNDKWGFFLNDTIAWERFTLTPALRYDRTSRDGEFWSQSLGATVNLTDRTLLRANYARGYSLSTINFDPAFTNERIWAIHAGIETTEIPFLWLKAGWFRNTARDVAVNGERLRLLKEGFEVEARTTPFFDTWLSLGYVFIDARNADTDRRLQEIPRQTWDLGLHYDDRTFRGALLGHYIWWNEPSTRGGIAFNARYDDFIWDLNLGWKAYKGQNAEAELFFTGHNLFNGRQYTNEIFVNPSRWFEGGLRIKW
ncbi:TonB-dependent receptor plug domain-containing protein [Geobacter metallireducens]|nr:TonB-dependent receptor [Geobacter metallireducens]